MHIDMYIYIYDDVCCRVLQCALNDTHSVNPHSALYLNCKFANSNTKPQHKTTIYRVDQSQIQIRFPTRLAPRVGST